MRRLKCPWCDQVVDISRSDVIKTVNGRGIYKTEIYGHRSCYEKTIRRSDYDRQKVGADDKKDD